MIKTYKKNNDFIDMSNKKLNLIENEKNKFKNSEEIKVMTTHHINDIDDHENDISYIAIISDN